MSENIEQGWTIMVEELKGHRVDDSVIEDDHSFVEGFWAGVKATSPKEAKIKLDKEQGVNAYFIHLANDYIDELTGVERKKRTIRRKPVRTNTNMDTA